MRKLIYYVAASSDGYIADNDDGIDWLEDEKWNIPGEDYGYQEFYSGIDTTLMGYRTYAKVMDMGVPFPYMNVQNYVFTSQPDPMPCDEVCFVHYDAARFVRKCKDKGGEKNIWLVGGGILAGYLLQAGLIDEVILTTIPVTLGKGIPLFGEHAWPAGLRLEESLDYQNGVRQERWVF